MQLSLFQLNMPVSESAEDNEIDVAPVMNMFIILVTFLISMTVFTHIAILQFTLPPNVSKALDQSRGRPKLRLTVRLGSDFLGVVLGDRLLDSLPVAGGRFPFEALAARLKERRAGADERDEIVIATRDEVAFKQVVRVMDLCRDAGFGKVGLSSATVNPEAGR